MEIDITEFVTNEEPYEFSGSIAERGPNAGPQTWANASQEAQRKPLLTTEDQLDAMRQWVKESGGWDKAERDAMSPADLNAMFIQLISGDMREMGLNECDLEDFDWEEYQVRAEEGQISGNIFRCDIENHESFGRFFYYLGS